MTRLGAAVLVAFALLPATAAGDEFYVDAVTGSDSNSGTSPANAWKTLQKVNGFAFGPGDTIHFKRGCVWTGKLEAPRSGTSTSPITYRAYASGPRPSIRNPGVWNGSPVSITGDWNVVKEFFLTDAHEAGILIAAGADHNVVRDNEITETGIGVLTRGRYNLVTGNEVHDLNMIIDDNEPWTDYGAVCFWIEAADNEIAHNRGINGRAPCHDFGWDGGFVEVWQNGDNSYIHHNYAENTNGFFELGGNSNNGSARNVTVAYNVIVNVTLEGAGTSVCFNTGNYDIDVASFKFENNTYVSESGHPDAYRVFGCRNDLTHLELCNNIFYSDIQIANNGNFSHTDNLYYMTDMVNGNGVGYNLGAGEMTANPRFVDLNAGILRLLQLSPAVDAGADLNYTDDFEGTLVPQFLAPDLGAYEFSLPGTDAGPPIAPAVSTQGLNLSAWPNPFRRSTTLQLHLPVDGAVEIFVYDSLGRLVRELSSGNLSSGVHRIPWDGYDRSGSRAAAGVYFVEARQPTGRARTKVVVLQ